MVNPLKKSVKAITMAIAGTVLLIIFLIIALLLAPVDYIPEFNIQERDKVSGGTYWDAHGQVAVFSDKIKPGDSGYYEFILVSECEADLSCVIVFTEYLNTTAAAHPFMLYRITMDGVPLGDGEFHFAPDIDHANFEILPGDRHSMKLEWKWEFENGTDENDTLLGIAGGKLSVEFYVGAEVIYNDEW